MAGPNLSTNIPYANYGYGYQQPSYAVPSYQPQGIVVNFVLDEEEARNTYVSSGTNAYFMHKNEPILYIKSVDQSGRVSSFKAYDLVERKTQEVSGDYVKASDLEAMIASVVEKTMADAGWRSKKKKEDE